MPAPSSSPSVPVPRSRFVYHLSSHRSNFSHPYHLLDVDVIDKNLSDVEYRRQKLPGFDNLPRIILSSGFQAQAQQATQATQTRPIIKINQSGQTQSQTLSQQEIDREINSSEFSSFLSNVGEILDDELARNLTIDLFKDELQVIDDEEEENIGQSSNGNNSGSQSSGLSSHSVSLFHSFHHLSLSKHHTVNSVEWHPHRACIAFSLTPSWSFDQWCEHSGEVSLSYILLYDLASLLHPYCIIKVPGLVTSFKFHPQQPAYLAAGLQTGQCILYQITAQKKQHKHALKQKQAKNEKTENSNKQNQQQQQQSSSSSFLSALTSTGLDANSSSLLPSPLYALLSNLDRSHGRPVTDIHWLPQSQQLTRKGELLSVAQRPNSRDSSSAASSSHSNISSQFLSLAGDGRILYWDMKHLNEPASQSMNMQTHAANNANANVSSFQSTGSMDDGQFFNSHQHEQRDGKWSPIFSLPLAPNQPNSSNSSDGENGENRSGGRGSNNNEAEMVAAVNSHVKVSSAFPVSSTITARKLASGALNNWQCFTSLSEDGEIIEIDSGSRPANIGKRAKVHSSMGNSIDRSILLTDLYLSCGETTWALWIKGNEWPIFISPPVTVGSYSCAKFSPSRPSVLAIARSDGVIEIWDCLDASHAPSYQFAIGADDRVTNLSFQSAPSQITLTDIRAPLPFLSSYSSTRQYLAAGDSSGKCHIVEMPRPLRKKLLNEDVHMRAFIDRETKRGKFSLGRESIKRTGKTPITPYTEQQFEMKTRKENQTKMSDNEAESAYEILCKEMATER